jgi:hypothetical protein
MKDLIAHPKFKKVLYVIGGLLTLMIAFSTGMEVGYHRAQFSRQFDDNYFRAYGKHRASEGMGWKSDPFEAHGAIGRVVSISLPTLIVEDRNMEKLIRVSSSTEVRKGHQKITVNEIMPNDFIVVFGSPNQSNEVEAKLIRTLPPPPGWSAPNISTTTVSSTTQNI